MAFVVEDGTGLINSNAYVSAQELKDYFKDRGRAITPPTGDIEKAIVNATDFIDSKFSKRFLGNIKFPETPQALEFPRDYWVDPLPLHLKIATYEYALFAFDSDLDFVAEFDNSGMLVTLKQEKVGPIEVITEFSKSNAINVRSYDIPRAQRAINVLLTGGQGGVIR
jgi:hypothetical protein